MSRNKGAAIDLLRRCADKTFALSCLDLEMIGHSQKGCNGLEFLLKELADELKEIEEELRAEQGNLKAVNREAHLN